MTTTLSSVTPASRGPLAVRAPGSRLKLRVADHIYRAGVATLRAYLSGASPEREAKAMFGDDGVTELVLKAASTPATTTVPGWAKELAAVAVYDLIASAASLSAGAALIDRALKINMDGLAEAHVPGRIVNAAAAGAWVAEGSPAPVRSFTTNAAILR